MTETSNFKFGMQLGFANYANHKITPNDKSGHHCMVLG